jgi:multicomponent Na+:H+ antiporter subunit B
MSLPFTPDMWISLALLAMLVALVVGMMWTRSLLTAIMLMSAYSLVGALWFLEMDAPDVAFTEAVVGAGVSTVLMLGAILLARARDKTHDWKQAVAPGAVVLLAGAALVRVALGLPGLGDPFSPANASLGRLYMQRADGDIGVPNVVSAVLASYRGFDTLGETGVIYAAGIGVALMLGFGERALADMPAAQRAAALHDVAEGNHQVVLRIGVKLLIPLITLYAFYVQFHGDLGPGGGFQAGVILAVAVILHALVFGLSATIEALPAPLVRGVAALGVLVYAGVGILCVVNGGAFLEYDQLLPKGFEPEAADGVHAHLGQHVGIIAIEAGVMLTVAATMVAFFYGFAGRAPDLTQDEEKEEL